MRMMLLSCLRFQARHWAHRVLPTPLSWIHTETSRESDNETEGGSWMPTSDNVRDRKEETSMRDDNRSNARKQTSRDSSTNAVSRRNILHVLSGVSKAYKESATSVHRRKRALAAEASDDAPGSQAAFLSATNQHRRRRNELRVGSGNVVNPSQLRLGTEPDDKYLDQLMANETSLKEQKELQLLPKKEKHGAPKGVAPLLVPTVIATTGVAGVLAFVLYSSN